MKRDKHLYFYVDSSTYIIVCWRKWSWCFNSTSIYCAAIYITFFLRIISAWQLTLGEEYVFMSMTHFTHGKFSRIIVSSWFASCSIYPSCVKRWNSYWNDLEQQYWLNYRGDIFMYLSIRHQHFFHNNVSDMTRYHKEN